MPQSEEGNRLTERDWDMWTAYIRGTTQAQIAKKHHLSQSAVSLRLRAVRESIPPEEKELVVRRHLDVFADMLSELYPLVKADPVPAYSNGKRMMQPDPDDPEGPEVPVWDHSGRMQAMDRIEKFLTREAKLVGVEAPTVSEFTGTVDHKPSELLSLIERARQQNEEDESRLREGPA